MVEKTILTEEVKEKWAPVLQAEGVAEVKDITARNNLIRVLENQEQALQEAANEGGTTGTVANYDPVLISLVRRTQPVLIANELIGVQPMSGPTGLIFAMRPEYQGTRTTQNTQEAFADANAGTAGTRNGGNYDNGGFDSPQQKAGTLDKFHTMTTGAAEILGGSGNDWQEMGFTISKKSVTAGTRALKARYTQELAHDLKVIHGLDAETELSNLLSTEITAEINREIIHRINRSAELTTAIQDINNPPAALIVPTAAPTATDSVNGPFEDDGTAATGDDDLALNAGYVDLTQFDGRWELERWKNLYMFIAREAMQVGVRTRRGVANWVLASPTVVAGLQMAGMLDTNAAMRDGVVDMTQATFVGVLGGRFKVYVDPYATYEYFTLGYKGSNVYDAGMFYCPYVPLTFMKSIGEEDFQPRIGFKTRYGMVTNPYVDQSDQTVEPYGTIGDNFYYRTCRVFGING